MVVVTVVNESYHMDDKLKKKWDKIKDGRLKKTDDDRCYIVDGRERCGKSVFTLQQAGYIDPTIINDLSRICFTADEFLEAIRKTESTENQTKVIIFDEAFRGLSSRSAISKINKKIIQALMEMGQKNLVVFMVLPSFFMLDIYPAVLRSNALFHIGKEKRSNLRAFKAYNYKKKARIYDNGIRKGWEYKVPSRFRGRFFNKYPGGSVFEKIYRDKKLKSLQETDIVKDVQEEEGRISRERKVFLANWFHIAKKHLKTTQEEFVQAIKKIGVDCDRSNISKVYGEVWENGLICEL